MLGGSYITLKVGNKTYRADKGFMLYKSQEKQEAELAQEILKQLRADGYKKVTLSGIYGDYS